MNLISSLLEPILCEPDDIILDYGDISTSIYFIAVGSLQIYHKRLSCRDEKPIRVIYAPSHFGEISLFYNSPTLEKYKSKQYSLLGALNKKGLAVLMRFFPRFEEKLKQQTYKHSSNWIDKLHKIYSKMPCFRGLPDKATYLLIHNT